MLDTATLIHSEKKFPIRLDMDYLIQISPQRLWMWKQMQTM